MPVYQYQCRGCQRRVERLRKIADRDKPVSCECGRDMEKVIPGFNPKVWKPLTLEHINVEGEGPLTFNSEGELRRYCKKHGLGSGALL